MSSVNYDKCVFFKHNDNQIIKQYIYELACRMTQWYIVFPYLVLTYFDGVSISLVNFHNCIALCEKFEGTKVVIRIRKSKDRQYSGQREIVIALLLIFLVFCFFCLILYIFVLCLVPNVTSVSELFILDFLFKFALTFIHWEKSNGSITLY